MLVIVTLNQKTSVINKGMMKELLTLAFINPELTLDEDNPETGKPYRFLDFCSIYNDMMDPDFENHIKEKFGIEDINTLPNVPYVNSHIFQVVQDYLELLKEDDKEIEVNGESGTFTQWLEVMYERLTEEQMQNDEKHLDIFINDLDLAELYGKSLEEIKGITE